jgi:hypothetical protein
MKLNNQHFENFVVGKCYIIKKLMNYSGSKFHSDG